MEARVASEAILRTYGRKYGLQPIKALNDSGFPQRHAESVRRSWVSLLEQQRADFIRGRTDLETFERDIERTLGNMDRLGIE